MGQLGARVPRDCWVPASDGRHHQFYYMILITFHFGNGIVECLWTDFFFFKYFVKRQRKVMTIIYNAPSSCSLVRVWLCGEEAVICMTCFFPLFRFSGCISQHINTIAFTVWQDLWRHQGSPGCVAQADWAVSDGFWGSFATGEILSARLLSYLLFCLYIITWQIMMSCCFLLTRHSKLMLPWQSILRKILSQLVRMWPSLMYPSFPR